MRMLPLFHFAESTRAKLIFNGPFTSHIVICIVCRPSPHPEGFRVQPGSNSQPYTWRACCQVVGSSPGATEEPVEKPMFFNPIIAQNPHVGVLVKFGDGLPVQVSSTSIPRG
ncbi:hypothetical protein TNCV_799261 [Trichonephila clavipes]|nr:hypothetical protein TNCV_799261 [Trichonephila clavipes]